MHSATTFKQTERNRPALVCTTGAVVVVPTENRTTVMNTRAASSSVPCEYDPECGGFPLAVLEHLPPAELCCVACQRLARDAVTACKGPRASRLP